MAVDKNKLMVKALKYVQKSDYDRALKEIAPALKAFPKDANLLTKQGEWLTKSGKRKEASAVFMNVAEIFMNQGFLKKALAVYRQMIHLIPDDISVHEKLADLYQQLGYISEAKAEFETIATFYEKKGEIQKALDTLQSMVELEPENLVSRIKLADHYAKEQIFSKASIELEKVASTLKEQNRSQEYLKVAERLYKYQPENRELALEIAQICHAQKDLQGALNTLHKLYKADPKHIPTLELLAQVFLDMQQKKKSLAIWLELARIYQESSDEENRKRSYKHVLEIDPNNSAARTALGMPVASQSKPQRASQEPSPPKPEKPKEKKAAKPAETKDIKKKVPAHIDKMLTEIDVYVKYGLLDQAFEHIAKILKEEPENLDAHKLRVSIAKNANRTEVLVLALAELGRVQLIFEMQDDLKKTIKALEDLCPNDNRLAVLKAGGTEFPKMTSEEVILIETGEFSEVLEAAKPPEVVKKPPESPKPSPEIDDSSSDIEDDLMALDDDELSALDALDGDGEEASGGELDLKDAQGLSDDMVSLDDVDDILALEPDEEDSDGESVVLDDSGDEEFLDEYEEADFFVEQGLIEEARDIYKGILEKNPDHGETIARLEVLDSGSVEGEIKVAEDRSEEGSSLLFDLGEELESSVFEEPDKPAPQSSGSVFEQVRAASSPQFDDAENHINLGIAYREMGLFKEAIDEFLQAAAHPSFAIQAYELIGRCHIDQSDYNEAISQFKKALAVKDMDTKETVSVFYELGEAYLNLNDMKEAAYYYKKVVEMQPDFREVQERLKQTKSDEKGSVDTSDWSDDNFLSDAEASLDENFDDLFNEDGSDD